MSMFILAISCLFTSNLPSFMDLDSCLGSFEGGHHYLHYSTIVWPQVNSREGTHLHPSTENWFKNLQPCPSEQDPVSLSVSLSHQEAFISLLSFSIRGLLLLISHFSRVRLLAAYGQQPTRLLRPWDFPGKSTGVGNMLLEISGEITSERVKRQSQSKNNTQLWMWLVIEAKSDAVKNNIA